MDSPNQPAQGPASSSLIGRWLAERDQPFTAPDNSELDLGYESALPWFADSEAGSLDDGVAAA